MMNSQGLFINDINFEFLLNVFSLCKCNLAIIRIVLYNLCFIQFPLEKKNIGSEENNFKWHTAEIWEQYHNILQRDL